MQVAKQGSRDAIYKVGYMYLVGRGIKQDYIKAYKYISKAAERNHPDAKSLLVAPIKETIKKMDYPKVLKMFETVTLKKIASLEYNIGCFYENGFDNHESQIMVEKDFLKALEWYRLAAKKSNPKAIHKLGVLYQTERLGQNYSVAARYYKIGVELEHLDSFYELAQLYLVGMGVTEDVERAFNLFSEAANLGHPGARSVLSLLYETKTTIGNSFENDSIKWMIESVGINGNTIVQYRLGCYYEYNRNIRLAIKWYDLATQGKLTDAYYRLGRMYETKDYQKIPKAIELYETASDNYHDKAAYREAQLYHYGIVVSQNYSKAFQLYTKAAGLGNWSATAVLDIKQVFRRNCVVTSSDTETSNTTATGNKLLNLTSEELNELLLMHEDIAEHGDANQQYNVGYVYENGLETPDYEKALRWYSIAASSSHKNATYRLGLLYLNGDGLPQNLTLAIEIFKTAMVLGSADAYYQLGLMHYSGKATDIDYSKAEQHYIVAANMGHCDAQLELGQLYEDGYIEGKGFLHALKWYTEAYFQENTRAIAHLYILDGEQGFEKEFYVKLFKNMNRYKEHLEENRSNDGTLELEPRYGQVTGDIFQFYGYVYYQLGYMYFSGYGAEIDFEKAWHHFNISHKVFNTKEALRFMIIGTEEGRNLETPTYLKKIEMFSVLASKLDAKQLYQLASVIYNKNRFKHTNDNWTLNQDDKFAFGLLERSVKEGYINSKKLLGDFYYFGYGVAIDYKKSLQNHIDYANTQDGQENFRAGVEHYDSKKYNSKGWNIALVYITKASNQKNINAQKFLFDTFYSGQNTTPFIKEIRELHRALADQQSDNENIDAGIRYFYRWRNPLTGLVYLHRAADQDNPVALRILGDLYCYGDNVDKNYDKAKELHKSSSIQLSSRECLRIGESYYKGTRLFARNHEIAFIYLNESITKDNYNTGRYLDDTYSFGDAVEIDEIKALRLHEIFAATLGEDNLIYVGQTYYRNEYYSIAAIYLTKIKRKDKKTLRSLGDMYYDGKGIEKNYKKALWCHKVSANLSKQVLNCRIGLEYFNTTYKSKVNVETGLIYINEAINQGSSTAARVIADKYYYGDDGIDEDQVKALGFYKISADRQDKYGNFAMGKGYYEGNNDYKKNTAVGLIYLNTAAFDQSYSDALRYLADLFFYGDDDTEEDQVKALELHKMSADHQRGYINFKTGKDYYEGNGDCKKNIAAGLVYLNIAAFDQSYPEALQYLGDLFFYGDDDTDEDQAKALELDTMVSDCLDGSENFRKGTEYYEGNEHLKKNPIIGYIYISKALDKGRGHSSWYLKDIYYFGEAYEKYPKIGLDLRMTLENNT